MQQTATKQDNRQIFLQNQLNTLLFFFERQNNSLCSGESWIQSFSESTRTLVEPNKQLTQCTFYFCKTYIITFTKARPRCDLFKSASLAMAWIRVTLLYTPVISSHLSPPHFSFTVISGLRCLPVRPDMSAGKTEGLGPILGFRCRVPSWKPNKVSTS